MKKYKLFITTIILVSFLAPSVVFASWWNPISWFRSEEVKTVSIQVSSSTPLVDDVLDTQTKSSWWNPFSWDDTETTTQNTPNNIELELETAKAQAETEKYKLEAEQTRLEIEKLKQETQVETQTKQVIPIKEVSKNSIITLPNGSVLEIDEYGNTVRTIQEAPQKLPVATTQIQQSNSNSTVESCLSKYYSRAEIQSVVNEAKTMYENTATESRSRINSTYESEISYTKSQGEQKLTSAREAQRGFGTNTAYLNQITSDTEESVKDLEARRDELLSSIQVTLSQQLSDLQMKQMKLDRESEEVMCY